MPVGCLGCAVAMDSTSRTSSIPSTSGRPAHRQTAFRIESRGSKVSNLNLDRLGKRWAGTRQLVSSLRRSAGKGAQQNRKSTRTCSHGAASANSFLDKQTQPQPRISLTTEYDGLIIGLAVPALGSILLDPIMSLVDTGNPFSKAFCKQRLVRVYHSD